MKKISQAVILAAGDGTRLWPLTVTRPKPFLCVLEKPILERKLDILKGVVDQVVLVVGRNKEVIRENLGREYEGVEIKYVEQKERLGTGHALKSAEEVLEKRFLVLNGDDIYGREGVEKCLKKFPSILTKEVEDITQFGAVLVKDGVVEDLVEKPKKRITDLANIGVYSLPKSVLKTKIERSERGEYEITDYVRALSRKENLYFARAETWIPVSYPWDLLKANRFFLQKMEPGIEGEVEQGVEIRGPVVVKKGALIKSGTRIEGPVFIGSEARIGPHSYIRDHSCIGEGCRIGASVEIKNSVIEKETEICHLSFVGDSVIGEGCNLGASTVTANLRFDEKDVRVEVKGEMVSTHRRKFGVVFGDGVKTGIHVSLMPGVMVAPNKRIMPGRKVKRNLE